MTQVPNDSAQHTQGFHVSTLGIVGAGLMGSGIAQIAAQRGITTRIFDITEGAAQAGRDTAAKHLHRLAVKGKITETEAAQAIERLVPVHSIEEAADSNAVIEAVTERTEIKQATFKALAEAADDTTLLATNTSALPITEIAGSCSRPEQVIGMHFFSPVPVMGLCEIIRGYRTSDSTVVAALSLAEQLGKESIVVNRDDAGFVSSRLMTVLVQEATRIVESGLASAEDVDMACELGFGHRMGPLATTDLTGVDVAYRAGLGIYNATHNPRYAPPELMQRMVSAGALGRKSGAGFYDYPGKESA